MLKSFKTTPLVWDSGASFRLNPYCADFIDNMECDIDIKDISNLNKVIGFGMTLHKFTVQMVTNSLPALSYHLPSADIHLFSPQAYY